jgi:hypothetical protein
MRTSAARYGSMENVDFGKETEVEERLLSELPWAVR